MTTAGFVWLIRETLALTKEALVDGGSVTAASFGVMDQQGKWAIENVGVHPDVEVEERPDAVIAGRDPQLEEAVRITMEALRDYKRQPKPAYFPPVKR